MKRPPQHEGEVGLFLLAGQRSGFEVDLDPTVWPRFS